MFLFHDNAHTKHCSSDLLEIFNGIFLDLPDLISSDCHLFTQLKVCLHYAAVETSAKPISEFTAVKPSVTVINLRPPYYQWHRMSQSSKKRQLKSQEPGIGAIVSLRDFYTNFDTAISFYQDR